MPLNESTTETVELLDRLESLGGASDIAAINLLVRERIRQIEQEGWSPAMDDSDRKSGELSAAGACYALAESQRAGVYASTGSVEVRHSARQPAWPFSPVAWKPNTMRRMIVKALALLLAELARLIRGGIE